MHLDIHPGRLHRGIDIKHSVEFPLTLIEEHLGQILRWEVLRSQRPCRDLDEFASNLIAAREVAVAGDQEDASDVLFP